MSKHVKHKHVKSQKQHLDILWGWGAEDRGLTYEAVGRGLRKTNTLLSS